MMARRNGSSRPDRKKMARNAAASERVAAQDIGRQCGDRRGQRDRGHHDDERVEEVLAEVGLAPGPDVAVEVDRLGQPDGLAEDLARGPHRVDDDERHRRQHDEDVAPQQDGDGGAGGADASSSGPPPPDLGRVARHASPSSSRPNHQRAVIDTPKMAMNITTASADAVPNALMPPVEGRAIEEQAQHVGRADGAAVDTAHGPDQAEDVEGVDEDEHGHGPEDRRSAAGT